MVLCAHEYTHTQRFSEMHGPNKFSILNRQVFCFISFHSAPCLISFTFAHTICNFIVLIVTRNLREQCMKIMMMVCDIIFAFYTAALPPTQSIINARYGENKIKNKREVGLNWQKSVKSAKSLSWILWYRRAGARKPLMCAHNRNDCETMQCVSFTMHTLVLFHFYGHMFSSAPCLVYLLVTVPDFCCVRKEAKIGARPVDFAI